MSEEEKKKKRLELFDLKLMLTLAGAGCIVVLFFLFIGQLGSVLEIFKRLLRAMTPIIIGFVIAFLLNPLVNRLRNVLGKYLGKAFPKAKEQTIGIMSNVMAVALSIIFFIAIIISLLWVLIPELYESFQNFYNNFDKYTKTVESWGNKLIKDNEELIDIYNNYIGDIEENVKKLFTERLLPSMKDLVSAISSGIVGGVKFVFNFVIGIIAAIYILFSKDKFSAQGKKFIYAVFNREKGNDILSAIDYVDAVFSGFIGGKLLDSFIIGVICFIFCELVNMPYAVLISVIIGITNIIPFFGPFIGAIPSAFLVLVESPKMCIVFIIFIIILQQVDGNIIGPLILSDSTGLSSFWVLFAILVGGNLFGFAGMVLGVPAFACLYALLIKFLRDNLNKRGLKNDTEYFVALRGFDENGNPIRGPKKKMESASDRRKRERQLKQLQQSREFFDSLTHHDKRVSDKTSNNKDNNDQKDQ